MNSSLAERIAICVARLGGQNKAAKLIDISQPGLGKWIAGKAAPQSFEQIVKLAALAGVSLDWLAHGTEVFEQGVLIPRYAPDAFGNPALQPPDADTLTVHRDFFTLQRLDPSATGIVRVMGDAMAPDLPEGSLVIIDMRSRLFQDEGLYVIGQPGRAIVRRPFFAGATMSLVAANKAYTDIPVPAGKTADFKVWGRAALVLTRP